MNALASAESTASPTPSTPPKMLPAKSPFSTYSRTRSITSYLASSSWTVEFFWSWSSQPGAFRVSAATWSLITGTIASTNRPRAISTPTMTASTAHERLSPRPTKNSTTGLRPAARNIATTISTRTEEIASTCVPSQYASSTPSPPKKPR